MRLGPALPPQTSPRLGGKQKPPPTRTDFGDFLCFSGCAMGFALSFETQVSCRPRWGQTTPWVSCFSLPRAARAEPRLKAALPASRSRDEPSVPSVQVVQPGAVPGGRGAAERELRGRGSAGGQRAGVRGLRPTAGRRRWVAVLKNPQILTQLRIPDVVQTLHQGPDPILLELPPAPG